MVGDGGAVGGGEVQAGGQVVVGLLAVASAAQATSELYDLERLKRHGFNRSYSVKDNPRPSSCIMHRTEGVMLIPVSNVEMTIHIWDILSWDSDSLAIFKT